MGVTPDFNTVTLKWAGTYLDGDPAAGYLELSYDGPPMLDDNAASPISIYPTKLTTQIVTQSLTVTRDSGGEPVEVTVGYVEWTVPASNVPDITGSGGTYTVTEVLTKGGGLTRTFVADQDAPDGVIWVNKLPAGGSPTPGLPLSVVYWSHFEDLTGRVEALESTEVEWDSITGRPETYPSAPHRHSWSDLDEVPATFPPTTPPPVVHFATFFNSTTDNVDTTTPSSKNAATVRTWSAGRSDVRLDFFWKRTAAAGSWTKILELPSAVPAPAAAVEVYVPNIVAGAPARAKINAGSREIHVTCPAGTFNGQISYST